MEWGDNFDKSGWAPKQIGYFLACFPFTKDTWDRASQWLKESPEEYWTRTDASICQAGDDLTIAIEKLIEHGRPHAAINCLAHMRLAGQPINAAQCIRALLAVISSRESTDAINEYNIVELIKFLQSEPSTAQEDLFKVEWAYLSLLDHQKWHHEGSAPKFLESRLSGDPDFFCEVIRLVYRSNKEEHSLKKPTKELAARANNAMLLLHNWKTPPGLKEDGLFNASQFGQWLQRVKTVCAESGHLEIAMSSVGEVLVFAPPDPNGLWIHQAVAAALNETDSKDMRSGFSTGTYNSRGAHFVDPTGTHEKELADQFRHKADSIENAGFHRFAAELRNEAERVINQYKNRD